ncbi:MAG: phosphatidylserine decarboxylase [Terracidiphilus sp.]
MPVPATDEQDDRIIVGTMVRDGYIYGLSLLVVAAVVAWATGNWAWGIAPVLLAAFFLWFFRDPQRMIPAGDGLIVSPGDGLVTETITINTPQGPRQRISIFLSVFDVHVNRSPIGGVLSSVRYQKGQYLNAMNPASADHNEQNIVTVRGADGVEVTFKQIAGLLARRIVFVPKTGDAVERGQRVGLIKFGSRVDVLVPSEAVVLVKVGERVKGGESVLAAMGQVEVAFAAPAIEKELGVRVLPDPTYGEAK